MEVGEIVIGAKLDTKDFTAQISKLEKEVAYYEKSLQDTMKMDAYKGQADDVEDLSNKLEKTKNQLSGLYKQQEKINQQGYKEINRDLQKIDKTSSKVVKSVGRWALAIIGIRSIYTGIRSAISSVAQYNEQVATDLEYIRYAMAQMLAPVVEYIVSLMGKLLMYVGYLTKAWFGVNIFAKASANNFKKATNEAKGMKKVLGFGAFDEANTIGNNNAGGTSGIKVPTFDLGEDIKVPKWLEWIKNNEKLITGILGGIALGLTAIELGLGGINAIIAAGIFIQVFLVLTGIFETIENIVKFIKDPSWNNFYNIIMSLYDAGGLVGLIFKEFFTMFFRNGNDLKNFFRGLKETMTNPFLEWAQLVTYQIENIKGIFKGLGQFFKGIFTLDIKTALNGLKTAFSSWATTVATFLKTPFNTIISMINTIIGGFNKLSIKVPDWVPSVGGKSWNINISKIPKLARGGLVNNPGKGVMMGSYIGGEGGPELVAPLTDPVALETIGQAIGKYITINANIMNSMDGRVISRELKRVQSNNDFAFNR